MSSTGFDEYRHLTEAARRLEAYKRMEPSIQNDGKGDPCQITIGSRPSTMNHSLWPIVSVKSFKSIKSFWRLQMQI